MFISLFHFIRLPYNARRAIGIGFIRHRQGGRLFKGEEMS
jgi:hypothetical protein